MQNRIHQLYLKMIAFDRGQPDLIQHFTKVHAYAKLIAELEGIDAHLADKHGFSLNPSRTVFYGLCADCHGS